MRIIECMRFYMQSEHAYHRMLNLCVQRDHAYSRMYAFPHAQIKVLELGGHICMLFRVFVLFWLVLQELAMHGGKHVCYAIYSVCALFACLGAHWALGWNASAL